MDTLDIDTTLHDTQGHDAVILEDMKNSSWRPPVMWVEWFYGYKMIFPFQDSKKTGIEEVLKQIA